MTNNPTQLTLLQDDIRRRYETLSKRLKQVARYILDNSNSIAFDTVASIAQQADVPPSTLIRFANAFGFSGFNEMKQVFRQHLMEETVNYTERARLFRQTATDDSASSPESPVEILNVFTMVNSRAAAAGDAGESRPAEQSGENAQRGGEHLHHRFAPLVQRGLVSGVCAAPSGASRFSD